MLCNFGLSVQAQDRYPHRTSIVQRGEQTINRDGETSGECKPLFNVLSIFYYFMKYARIL